MEELNATTSNSSAGQTIVYSLVIAVSGTSILVNLFIVIVCFKSLIKEFQQLSVLCLLVCDITMGITLFWFGVSSLIGIVPSSTTFCSFEVYLMTVSYTTTYCMLFLICIQRYIAVKTLNFTQLPFFSKYKYRVIGGTSAGTLLYSLVVNLSIPHSDNVVKCSMSNHYGDNFMYFCLAIIGPVTIIITLVISLTFFTIYKIWSIFIKPKIHPSATDRTLPYPCSSSASKELRGDNSEIESNMAGNEEAAGSRDQSQKSRGMSRKETSDTISQANLGNQSYPEQDINVQKQTNGISTEQENEYKVISVVNNTDTPSGSVTSLKTVHDPASDGTLLESLNVDIPNSCSNSKRRLEVSDGDEIHVLHHHDHGEKSDSNLDRKCKSSAELCSVKDQEIHVKQKKENSTDVFKVQRPVTITKAKNMMNFEVRACVTSVIIISTTIVLTGPFLISLWLEVFQIHMSDRIRLLLFSLHMLNFCTDPIVYVWRVPVIRKRIRNVLNID